MRLKFQMAFNSVLLILPLLVTNCVDAAKPIPQVLNRGNGMEPKDLDPHLVTGVPEDRIISALFEGLTNYDPKTLEPIPGVAESWKISKDGKIYTFKLNKKAKWSNGEPITANDFVYSWRRVLNPKTAAQYAEQGHYIKNGKKIHKEKMDPKKLGVTAVDKHTLKVELEAPTPFFLSLLTHYSLYPVPEKVVKKYGARWTRPEHIVSNGPFMLKTWELNKIITAVKNPHYWDKDTVKLTQVNFYPIDKQNTEEKMFRAGKLHVTAEVPVEKIPFWQKNKKGKASYQQDAYLGTYFIRINVSKNKVLKDKRVRRALALAVDRERLVKYVTRGGQIPATTFTPPGTGGYDPPGNTLPTSFTDAAKKEAKRLLAEAGYPNGKGFPTLQYLYNTAEHHKKIAEAIQQMWKKNLNVNIQLHNQEWKVYLANMRTLSYDIGRAGWIGDYNDPNTFLDIMMSGRTLNQTGWSNKKYDALIEKAAKEPDLEKRKKHFAEAETILLNDLPVIPIFTYTRVYLKSPKVKGWYPNIQDKHPLKFVSIGK